MSNLNLSSYTILGLLSKKNCSGYDLKQHMIKKAIFYRGSESNAQIYPVLKKLEKQSLVKSTIDKSSGARNKRIYAITKKGMEALVEWLEQDFELALYREEFVLQLSLGQHLNNAVLLKKVQHYRRSVAEKMKSLQEFIEHVSLNHKEKPDQRFLLLIYDHIHEILKAKIIWCDRMLKMFSAK